jgi:hypothetical protein
MAELDPRNPRYARDRDLSLAAAFRIFLRETPPRILVLAFGLMLGSRIVAALTTGWGALRLSDLLIAGVIFVLHPFVEWCIHVYVLHFRPRQWGGLRIDFAAARYHRAHHVDPWDLRYVAMPLSAMFTGAAILVASYAMLISSAGGVHTAMLASATLALLYEWGHFLTHTSYRPRGVIYKRIYKFHRLHHFKNERYWMGVTRHLGDYVLGTMKDPREVETSATAKDLLASFEAREPSSSPTSR